MIWNRKIGSGLALCFLLSSMSSRAMAQGNTSQHGSLSRAQVKEAESLLADLGYWTGPVDGILDPTTRAALIAFQKYKGRLVSGKLTLDELAAIRSSTAPKAKEVGYNHVEVDLDRQVLLLVSEDGGVSVLPVSTGNGKTFIDEGQESIAYTPRGRFLVYRKGVGWEHGPLGSVYYPNDISGGVAIHGSRSVPTQPASHGCIRVPMFAAREVSKLMPVGTIVLVYDKVSFVSAKSWAENPKLKQAALSASTADAYDYAYETDATQTRHRTVAIKRARSKIIRAGFRLNNPGDFLPLPRSAHEVPLSVARGSNLDLRKSNAMRQR
jgi:N-acetylmuramoyl-L-alanine amidase